jgi:T5SS/PEP-CTERM-associated repeat protein
MIASDAMITVGGTAEFGFGTADGVTLDSGTTMQAAAMLLETALTVTGATTMLGVTNLLMLDVVGAALDVAAGAAVSTGTFDVGMGTAVVEGAGSLLQVNGDAAIGFATSGASLTINCGGNATVAGDLMVGTSAGTGGSVTLDGSGTTLSVGGTVSVAAAQPTCIRSSAGRLVGTSARRSVCAQTAPA